MYALEVIHHLNVEAVVRSYREAIEDGHLDYADRIWSANPDLAFRLESSISKEDRVTRRLRQTAKELLKLSDN